MIFPERPTPEQVSAVTSEFNVYFFRSILRRTPLEKHVFNFKGQLVDSIRDPFLLNDVHTVAEHHIDALSYNDNDDTASRRLFCKAMLNQYLGASEGVFSDWSEKRNPTWCYRNREYMTTSLRTLFGRVDSVDKFRVLVRQSIRSATIDNK